MLEISPNKIVSERGAASAETAALDRARRDRAMADATARVVGTVRAKIHFFGINRAFSMRDEAVRRPERARSRRGKADASSDAVATRPSSTGDATDDRARAAARVVDGYICPSFTLG